MKRMALREMIGAFLDVRIWGKAMRLIFNPVFIVGMFIQLIMITGYALFLFLPFIQLKWPEFEIVIRAFCSGTFAVALLSFFTESKLQRENTILKKRAEEKEAKFNSLLNDLQKITRGRTKIQN